MTPLVPVSARSPPRLAAALDVATSLTDEQSRRDPRLRGESNSGERIPLKGHGANHDDSVDRNNKQGFCKMQDPPERPSASRGPVAGYTGRQFIRPWSGRRLRAPGPQSILLFAFSPSLLQAKPPLGVNKQPIWPLT